MARSIELGASCEGWRIWSVRATWEMNTPAQFNTYNTIFTYDRNLIIWSSFNTDWLL